MSGKCTTFIVKPFILLHNSKFIILSILALIFVGLIVAEKDSFMKSVEFTLKDTNWKLSSDVIQILNWTMEIFRVPQFGYSLLAILGLICTLCFLGFAATVKESQFLLACYGLLALIFLFLQ